jgi:hypothetical protein
MKWDVQKVVHMTPDNKIGQGLPVQMVVGDSHQIILCPFCIVLNTWRWLFQSVPFQNTFIPGTGSQVTGQLGVESHQFHSINKSISCHG